MLSSVDSRSISFLFLRVPFRFCANSLENIYETVIFDFLSAWSRISLPNIISIAPNDKCSKNWSNVVIFFSFWSSMSLYSAVDLIHYNLDLIYLTTITKDVLRRRTIHHSVLFLVLLEISMLIAFICFSVLGNTVFHFF